LLKERLNREKHEKISSATPSRTKRPLRSWAGDAGFLPKELLPLFPFFSR